MSERSHNAVLFILWFFYEKRLSPRTALFGGWKKFYWRI